jgi:hypothetical protein
MSWISYYLPPQSPSPSRKESWTSLCLSMQTFCTVMYDVTGVIFALKII